MSYFKDKTIWITGASSGIGRALAIELAAQGAKLILSSRKRAALEEVALHLSHSDTQILPLDLQDHDGLDQLIKDNQPLLASVDILINNGGISQRSKVVDTDFKVYKKLMDVNYLGAVKLSLGILPFFTKKKAGQFVVISSMAGKFGVPVRSGYSASKMALHGFFDAMRAELMHMGIGVTIICPGYIQTSISKNALTASGETQGTMDDAQRKGMPLEIMIPKVLKAIESRSDEIHIGGFREVKIAGVLSRFFPKTFKKIIAKSKVT